MSWTAPRTWVANEVATAAMFNTHLRDNLLETGPAKVTAAGQTLFATGANQLVPASVGVRLAGGTSVTSSVVLVNAAGMVFSVGASETWHAQFVLAVSNANPAGIRIGWSYPAGLSGSWWAIWAGIQEGGALAASGATSITASSSTTTLVNVWLTVVNGATPGTVQLMFAQTFSTAVATSINAGSTMRLVRLA